MYILNNGVKIPKIGFGTWKVKDETQCRDSVRIALETGYRHIDTAMIYGNEVAVGKGIADFLENSNVSREELFIVTKVWNKDQGYESTLKAFEESLKNLNLKYIDMYLIHWPQPISLEKTWETWKALEYLYKQGKVRAIGVCNMKEHHLKEILQRCEIVPAVNQIELHPHLQQKDLREYCKKNNILIEAWSPLMQGALDVDILKSLSEKYQKSVAQIILKWDLQHGMLPLPKSVTPSRIEDNFRLDFILSKEDMELIDSLDKNERMGSDPDKIAF